MNLRTKKGSILILAMVFVIIVMFSSIGFYESIKHVMTETIVDEEEEARAYYANLGALRYIQFYALNDPDSIQWNTGPGLPPILNPANVNNGNFQAEISMWNDYNQVAQDLGLTANTDIVVRIWRVGDHQYQVSSIFD